VSTKPGSLSQRVQSSYKRLTTVATDLNTVSDELGQSVSALDEALKKLNLGITSWYKFSGHDGENGDYWARFIGYQKIGTRWGIALSRTSGNHQAPEEYNKDEEWLFNDSPRQLRIEAVEHIPAMIEKLIEDAEAVIEKVKTKSGEARELAEALSTTSAKPTVRVRG
jgi:hypothetical protein